MAANIEAACASIRQAAADGATFVLLPENVTLLASGGAVRETAPDAGHHPAREAFAAVARESGVWLLAGSLAERADGDRLANRSLLFDAAGTTVAEFDKIHMFDVTLDGGESYRESESYRPGDRAVVAETPWGTLGMTVCYDLRFPHLYRGLAQAGAVMLSVPSAFTVPTGRDHWHVLLRARAIETGCFVFAPAQCGTHYGKRRTYGHSMIIDPWGEILAEAELKRDHPLTDPNQSDKLQAKYVINEIAKATNGEAVIVTGVGQHQMWAAQYYPFKEPATLVSSCGAGSMGYEVPGAMGAQVGRPDKVVWSVCGDGGFQMTMVELATLVENNIPVKYAIMNNNSLGMVRQWQELFYDKSYVATLYHRNPDFVKLAEAFGALGIRVKDKTQVQPAIQQAMDHDGPVVIDFVVEQEDNVYPMIPAGTSINELIEEPTYEKARQ